MKRLAGAKGGKQSTARVLPQKSSADDQQGTFRSQNGTKNTTNPPICVQFKTRGQINKNKQNKRKLITKNNGAP